MTTQNDLNLGLKGSTGTGTFVGSTSATLVTPTLGAATATSVAFSPTTGGIIGTTAADSAGAGKVGEVISSLIPNASAVSVTTATAKDVTSISLTAGDWDIMGNTFVQFSGAATTYLTWCSTTSASPPDASQYAETSGALTTTNLGLATPYLRVNVNTTTSVYLSVFCQFTTGACTASGQIFARRVR